MKLPDSSQFDALKSTLKDTAAATVAGFQKHVYDLKKTTDCQGERITAQSEQLVNLTKSLSEKKIGAQSRDSEKHERSQQQRIAESTQTMTQIEGVSTVLQEKLDIIIATLADQGGLPSLQLRPLEMLEKHMITQQVTLKQIQEVAEGSIAKVTDTIVTMEATMKEANHPKHMQETENWLVQFANQLLASGITSAMTGAVVLLAVKWKSSSSEKCADKSVSQELSIFILKIDVVLKRRPNCLVPLRPSRKYNQPVERFWVPMMSKTRNPSRKL